MLPGGLVENGVRLRNYAFRPADGALELQLLDPGAPGESLPAAVTRVLCTALDHIGDAPVDAGRARSLCVADRQFLMRELQRHLGREGFWGSRRCAACGEPFDYRVEYAELPVVEARGSYPWVEIALAGRSLGSGAGPERIRLRLPNGGDQERLSGLGTGVSEEQAARHLLDWCGAPAQLDDAALEAIDEAMDAVSPAVVTEICARCSHCGAEQVLSLEPYAALGGSADALLQEVHRLAWHYHWSESEILALPRQRRRRYLELIDRARGMVQ